MATFYADNIAGSTPSLRATALGDRTPGPEITPRTGVLRAKYTMVGTEAADDLVNIGRLPAGCVPLGHLALITSTGVGTTATADLGDDDVAGVGTTADPDRYIDGADIAAAGNDLGSAYAGVAQRTPYALGADAWIQLKFATLVTPTADGVIQVVLPYVGA